MAFGTLYTREASSRETAIIAVAKANNLELEIVQVDTANPTKEFLALNPVGKVPVFVGNDGFVLSESIAVAIYVTSQNEKTTLLGKTKQDYASILKWMSFFNEEVLPNLANWFRPLVGIWPYNKKNVDEAQKLVERAMQVVENHLLHNTFLVGERITLADLFAAGLLKRGFEFFYDREWRLLHSNVARWYETVYNQPIYSAVVPKLDLLDKVALLNQPPKKEKKEQPKKEQPKKEQPKKEAAKPKPQDDNDDEEPKEEPKPKHPLDLLPRSSFPLDEWKRFYSNNNEDVSLKWFWDNVPFSDYSLWKVQYKYCEELKLTFMSNNLIGGFFNRLSGSIKHIFGCMSVYGENNDSVIEGAFVIRGHEFQPAFDVAPDWESYEFTKLDPEKEEDREYVRNQWTWDQPVTVGEKQYAHASGKVCK